MGALEPVVATLVADIAQFKASMAEAKASMEELGASADTADAEGKLGAIGAAGSQAGKDVKLGAEDAVAGLGGVSTAAKDAEGAARSTESATKDLGTAAENTGGKLSGGLSGGLSKLGGILSNTGIPGVTSLGEGLARTSEEADKMGSSAGSLFTSFAGVGKIATLGLGVAFAGAAVEGLHLADNMQQATTAIANSAGISTTAANNIGKAFLSTAGQSEFSGVQMAQAFSQVAGQLKSTQGSALTAAQSLQVMNAAGDLATAKQTSLASATTTVAAAMQAFQLKAKDASDVSDILFNASNATGQSVSSLGAALDKVKTKLGGMAPPIGQLAGLLVDMTNHGETGRAAMASLTTTFTTFLKPAAAVATAQNNLKAATDQLPPSLKALAVQVQNGTLSSQAATKAAQGMGTAQAALFTQFVSANTAVTTAGDAAAKLGISVTTASGQMKPMSAIIGELHAKIAGMTTAQATAELTALGFGNASAKLVTTIQAGSAAYDKATAAATKMGAAHAAAAKQAATFKTEMETLKATAEDLLTQFGQELLPVLTTVAGAFEHATSFIVKSKAALIALGVLVGGPLAVVIGAFIIQSIQKLISFVTDAGSTVAQFGSKLRDLTQPATQAGETVTKTGDAVGTSVEEMATNADTAAGTFAGAMSTMGEAADALQGTVAAAMTAIEADIAAASANLSATVTEVTTGTSGASGALGGAGVTGAAGAAGASGAAGTVSSAGTSSIFEPAVVALQGAATSLEAAAASLKEAAGTTETAAGDTSAAAADTTTVAADMATTDANDASLGAADSADAKSAAGALDTAAGTLDSAGEKLSLSGGAGVAGGAAGAEGAAAGGAAVAGGAAEEAAVGGGIASGFLTAAKGAAGPAIGGLIAVQLYNAFLEKPLGKKIGTDAASALGDAGTGAAIGASFGSVIPGLGTLFGAAVGAAIGAAYASRNNAGHPAPEGTRQVGGTTGPGIKYGEGRGGGGQTPATPPPTPAQQDRAKDSTLQKQIAVMNLLNGNVAAAKAQDGVNSAQYKAAVNAVNTTSEKYLPSLGKDTSLAGVKLQMFAVSEVIGQLKTSAHSDQVYGNSQLEGAQKAVTKLEGEAMTEKTGGASKAAIDLTNQQLVEAKGHLADIKSVVADGTNAQHQIKSDTAHLATLEGLAGTMSKVNSDTSALHGDLTGVKSDTSDIHTALTGGVHTDLTSLHTDLTGVHSDLTGNGISISKLPSQTTKATGVLSLVLS